MTQDNNKIRESARELVHRLGSEALLYIQDRIAKISKRGMGQELDQAYRLLTEVEEIMEKET